MEKNSFWNDAAAGGIFVGVLVGASSVMETALLASGDLSRVGWLQAEWIVTFVLHLLLLGWLTVRRVRRSDLRAGSLFGQGYGFAVAVSMLSGIISSMIGYVYLHSVLGYETYIAGVCDFFRQIDGPLGLEDFLADMLAVLEQTPAPSLPATLFSGVFSATFYGVFYGLFIALAAASLAKPSSKNLTEDTDHE